MTLMLVKLELKKVKEEERDKDQYLVVMIIWMLIKQVVRAKTDL